MGLSLPWPTTYWMNQSSLLQTGQDFGAFTPNPTGTASAT